MPGQVTRRHATRAARPDVLEEALVQRPAEAAAADGSGSSPTMWTYASSGWSGLTNPTRKPTGRPLVVLGDPRRAGEMLEPQPREELVHLAAAPPLVDLADEHGVVGLDRAAEADLAGARSSCVVIAADAGSDRGDDDLERDEEPVDLAEVVDERQDAALGPGVLPQAELAECDRDDGQARRRSRSAGAPPGGRPAPNRSPAATAQPVAPATTTRPAVR